MSIVDGIARRKAVEAHCRTSISLVVATFCLAIFSHSFWLFSSTVYCLLLYCDYFIEKVLTVFFLKMKEIIQKLSVANIECGGSEIVSPLTKHFGIVPQFSNDDESDDICSKMVSVVLFFLFFERFLLIENCLTWISTIWHSSFWWMAGMKVSKSFNNSK